MKIEASWVKRAWQSEEEVKIINGPMSIRAALVAFWLGVKHGLLILAFWFVLAALWAILAVIWGWL